MIDLTLDVAVSQGHFSLEVSDRSRVEVLGLFGSSGAGKTTLLEAVVGLRTIHRGEVRVGERVLFSTLHGVNLPLRERRIGYVPQDAMLFPHLGVRANVMYGARPAAPPRRRLRSATDSPAVSSGTRDDLDLPLVAGLLEIDQLLDRPVQGLSGGERQRVAIARALMTRPLLLLLDEPLAGVDRARRDRILPYVLRIRRELHVPLVYVTHDVAELREIADRVLVIEDGRLLRAGAPAEVMR